MEISTIGVIVGGVLGFFGIVTALWKLAVAIHRGVNVIEHLGERVSSLETNMGERVSSLERTMSNGIRSDIRLAASRAEEARVLAARAATAAANAQQRAAEGRTEISRAVNSLRAEVNTLTHVAITDLGHVWEELRAAGLDRRGSSDAPPPAAGS